ncbi:MAG: hypothetical protein PHW45_01990, partial [Candidatus ainarchaeum sp.]|nr:hypothetical protein [Candidatus ainarchaeum sp.]
TIKQITITGYSLLDTPRVPLDPPVTIKAYERLPLDLGIVHSPFDLVLYLDDDTIITKTGMKTTNRQPRNCPEGFIPVPGNFLYDTTNDSSMGFCVAKWEMKADVDGDGKGDSNPNCMFGGLLVWTNTIDGCKDYNVVSSSVGYPITNIKQTEAITKCESIGGHLITNNEWMTLARNIEQVPENWSSGTIGIGKIKMGNNGKNEAGVSYDGNNPESGIEENRNTLSRLRLTNKEYIWDLSGNVWELINKKISQKDMVDIYNLDGIPNNQGWNEKFADYHLSSSSYHYIDYQNLGNTTLKYKDLFLLNPSYDVNNGIGQLHTYSNRSSTDDTNYTLGRGGKYNSVDDMSSGMLSSYFQILPNDFGSNFGFRCVVIP